MKKAEYKVISGTNGFPELEEKVSVLLSRGWKPVGGIGFNAGYPYQAMARVVNTSVESNKKPHTKIDNNSLKTQNTRQRMDELI